MKKAILLIGILSLLIVAAFAVTAQTYRGQDLQQCIYDSRNVEFDCIPSNTVICDRNLDSYCVLSFVTKVRTQESCADGYRAVNTMGIRYCRHKELVNVYETNNR